MNYLDLFHGIGGFALGAYWAGMKFENHFCSDIEPYTQKLYKLRFPDSVQLGDITKIDFEKLKNDYPGEWIITGGFPCQDISIAGKGAGIEGKRSGLWFEYWRAISILQPRFAIMENVGAITFRGLTEVIGSLHEIGYNAEWQDIRASEMGAQHRRERIWIIAYTKCKRWGQNIIEKSFKKTRNMGKYKFINSENIKRNKREPESKIYRKIDGIPCRVDRLKGLGNSIVPQIAELLFNLIKPFCNERINK